MVKDILKKLNSLTILMVMGLAFVHCGGGGSAGENSDGIIPILSPDPNADLSTQAVNTFLDSGVNITIDPTYVDLGSTDQHETLEASFAITNGTSADQTLSLSFYGTSGGFRLVKDDGSQSAYEPGFVLRAGASQSFIVQFDASMLGTSSGYIEVTSREASGYIHFPFRASVIGPSDFRVISSSYMCSDEGAPSLSELDFMRVASGRSEMRSFKICNTGGEALRIYSVKFTASSSDAQSDALTIDLWDIFDFPVTDALTVEVHNSGCADDYCNPEQDEPFSAPAQISPDALSVDEPSAFSVIEHAFGGSPDGILIAAGSYARLDVAYAPTLDADAGENAVYDPPISYAADMEISTSLGEVQIDVVGASGGKEPILEATYTTDPNDACLADACTPCPNEVDLNSSVAAIHFGTASVFEDWISEDAQDVFIKFKNNGSAGNDGADSNNLKIWIGADEQNGPIQYGYYLFDSENPAFPVDLGISQCQTVHMKYNPTPAGGEAGDFYDFGEIFINHNGGNGPHSRVTLVGEQESGTAVRIEEGGVKIKNTEDYDANPYENSRKSFCVVKNEEGNWSELTFTVYNNSSIPENDLTTTWTLDIDNQENGAPMATSSTPSGSVVTEGGKSNTFTIKLTPATDADGNIVAEITGILDIKNRFALEGTYGSLNNDSKVYFKANVSETGVCAGGTGQPLDGQATILIDRITMILDGVETARNPPAYKLQIPIELDKANGVARIAGVPYDPITSDPNAVNVFRIFNHQMGNVNKCYPMASSPYATEAKEGSWTDPETQCPSAGTAFSFTGKEACIAPNKPEEIEVDGIKYHVFYHEFVKFTPGTCAVEMEGRIATFRLGEGETISGVFADMEANVGLLRDDTPENRHKYQDFLHMFQFGSYIKFSKDYNFGSCTYSTGTTLTGDTQSEEIRDCWESFMDDSNMRRYLGMMEECTYFLFDVDAGCFPADMPGVETKDPATVCTDSNVKWSDPDTWVGLGEYGPNVDPNTEEESDTKWDLTMRNIHLEASFVINALNGLFDNPAKILFADLYATITTKVIGLDESKWNDLIAVQNRNDFDEEDVYISLDDAEFNWLEDGANSEFTAGSENDVSCFDESGNPKPLTSCKGNFMIRENGQEIMPAGEPINFSENNLSLFVAMGSFHGKPGLAPSFAQERADGTGKPLVFSLHGCVKEGQELAEDEGCYAEDWDDQSFMTAYADPSHGIISSSVQDEATGDTKALIDYIIWDEDRNRFTDYYNSPNNYYYDAQRFPGGPCALLN